MSSDDETMGMLEEDKDRTQIREELSQMSFEDLQKLKEKLGSKVYNEAIFGAKRVKKTDFKRENKNRPREMSAKRPVSRLKEVVHVKRHEPRDPRFDSLCGNFDEKAFKNSYSFLFKMKENDLKALKNELKTTEDPKQIKKIKYLIQRIENQLKEESRKKQREDLRSAEKREIVEAIKSGEKPKFRRKSEKRIVNLVSQYEELKSTGKLKKHIERLRKKRLGKDRKKFSQTNNDF
ncbi:ribosomal RNA processing protein 36 homolog [Diachasma alloeum]|uniref:ribosomal RNA processing protein 36 homolog n=1 Tax=Diachasma alloeum TaxID=454923 RepID=UPI0007382397|nr:ribosomal RNA processing protein 36 homolog [Diachasma alloeum]